MLMPTNPMKHTLPLAVVLCVLMIGLHAQSPTPDPQRNQLDAVIPKVAALSGEGAPGQVKAILSVALERAKACLDAGDSKSAGDLISDVESTLAKNPESLVAPSTQTNTISAIRTPMKVEGNPYIAKLVAGAKEELTLSLIHI